MMSTLVLLATYNGGQFLDEQIASLMSQSVDQLDVLVSDDGSSDATITKLQTWQSQWTRGQFEISHGPERGFAENFRSLILRAQSHDYVAFCDQDDVWAPKKLAAAIKTLDGIGPETPALYGSRSRLTDADGKPIGLSPLFAQPPGFRNALVQSLAGGNTMVFNRAAFAVLQESARRGAFLMHDWWSYLIVSGAGGVVHYDPTPHINYRQHDRNVIGAGIGILERPKRILRMLNGGLALWSDANIASLEKCRDLLTPQSQRDFDAFVSLRRAGPLAALLQLRRAGFYRQTVKGNLAMAAAAVLGRL